MMPAMSIPDGTNVEAGSLFADTLTAWDTINKENAVGHYID